MMAVRGRPNDDRVNALKSEYEAIQKKTFTKWANSHLVDKRVEIEDLYMDLRDGMNLLYLLEKLSGEELAGPRKPKMQRIHCLENVGKALKFIAGKKDIEVEGEDKKSAKEALILWCQRKVAGYPGVNIKNFTTSWRDGLAFNAIIHKHRPDLFDFSKLDPANARYNLEHAFSIAEKELGMVRLLDIDDMLNTPDEKSIMTYLAGYYHKFAQEDHDNIGNKRLQKVIGFEMEIQVEESHFELNSEGLVEWIETKIMELNSHTFLNSVSGVQSALADFKRYRTEEKPPRFQEKGELEAQLFSIQTQLREANRNPWLVPEDKHVSAVNDGWEVLEKAEHERELALRRALAHQEALARTAAKFARKAGLREQWLRDMRDMLQNSQFGDTFVAVLASSKKEDTIQLQISAYAERLQSVGVMAQSLASADYQDAASVVARSDSITRDWTALADVMTSRRRELDETLALHRACADMDVASTWIEEMVTTLRNESKGGDLNEAQELLQKHAVDEGTIDSYELTTNGLVNRHVENSSKAGYQSHSRLLQRRAKLEEQFRGLHNLAAERRRVLTQSGEYQQFLRDVRDEEAWIRERMPLAMSTDLGGNVSAALVLQKKHAILISDLAIRQKTSIEAVAELGKRLLADRSYAASDIKRHMERLGQTWARLKQYAAARKLALDTAVLAEQYSVGANEAESWMIEREPLAGSDDCGRDQLSAQELARRHGAVVDEIAAFSRIISSLSEQADEIVAQPLPQLPQEPVSASPARPVAAADPAVAASDPTHARASHAYAARQAKELSVAKNEIVVVLNSKDKNWWKVAREDGSAQGYVPAAYLKPMELTPAVPSEAASTAAPTAAATSSTATSFPEFRRPVQERQQSLAARHARLAASGQARAARLVDAQTLFRFLRDVTDLEEWIADRSTMAAAVETGSDVEHVQYLIKSFDNFFADMAGQADRVTQLCNDADALVAGGHSSAAQIAQRKQQLTAHWADLTAAAKVRRETLAAALEVEQFRRDAKETDKWIGSKLAVLPDDLGKDVSSVQHLQRQHAGFEADLAALEARLTDIDTAVKDLKGEQPEKAASLLDTQEAVLARWKELSARAADRKQRLEQACNLQQLASDHRDALAWINGVKAEMFALPLADDVALAESALQRMEQYRGELSARDSSFRDIEKEGLQLIAANHYAGTDIKAMTMDLKDMRENLQRFSDTRHRELAECLMLRRFQRDAAALSTWTEGKERVLEDRDTGASVGEVAALIKRHEDFAGQLSSGAALIAKLESQVQRMVQDKHSQSRDIEATLAAARARHAQLLQRSDARRLMLDDAKVLQAFLWECDDMSAWISAAMLRATDNAHQEAANLLGKMQAHAALATDIAANAAIVDGLEKDAQAMVTRSHFASPQITARSQQLVAEWRALETASATKTQLLREAKEQQDYARGVVDANAWCAAQEQALLNSDVGRDLTSARNLLKKHQALASDYAAQGVIIAALDKYSHKLVDSGNFRSQEITRTQQELNARYRALAQPIATQTKRLDDSVNLHHFLRLVAEEREWLRERQPVAAATDLAPDLAGAVRQQASHARFSLEVTARLPLVQAMLDYGAQLRGQNHPSSAEIAQCEGDVKTAYDALVAQTGTRHRQLEDALQSQQLLVDCLDAESNISDKFVPASNSDYGRDEDTTRTQLASHAVVRSDVLSHVSIVQLLRKRGQALCDAKHFDSTRIMEAITRVEARQAALQDAAAQRQALLTQRLQLHELRREIRESTAWIGERLVGWVVTDIGKDQDDCEALLKKAADLRKDVDASETERVSKLVQRGDELCAQQHVDATEIAQLTQGLQGQWAQLQQAMVARMQLLSGAFEIHRFNRNCDKLNLELHEKFLVASMTDVAGDVASAETAQRKHEGFERFLPPLSLQVDALVAEAQRLATAHPSQASGLRQQQALLQTKWSELTATSARRAKQLGDALDLQAFLRAFRFVMGWIREQRSRMRAHTLARDAVGAEALLKIHAGYKADIEAHAAAFTSVISTGEALVAAQHWANTDISTKCKELQDDKGRLLDLWTQLNTTFEHNLELLRFEEEAAAAAAWLELRHAQLGDGHVDDEKADVEAFKAQHNDLQTSLAAQESKFDALKRLNEKERLLHGPDFVKQYTERVAAAAALEQQRQTTDQQQRAAELAAQQRAMSAEQQRRAEQEAVEQRRRQEELARLAEDRRKQAQAAAAALTALDAAKAADQQRAMALAAASAEGQRSKEAEARAQQAQYQARVEQAKERLAAVRGQAAVRRTSIVPDDK